MNKIYHEVVMRLNQLDFKELYPGFKKYDFALYDDAWVYLKDGKIPKDQRFIGNTSIAYGDGYLAIWYQPKGDLDVLTANIVHEMFHVHQTVLNEKRIIDDLNGVKYPITTLNHQIKTMEAELLCDLIKVYSEDKMDTFIALRNKRIAINPMMDYEMAIESFEGIAEYVKYKALYQLSKDTYINTLNEDMIYFKEHLLDTRRAAYYSGAFLALILGDVDLKIGQETFHLYKLAKCHDRVYQGELKSLTSDIEEFILKRDDDFEFEGETISGCYRICGYDPMNMIGREGEILHKHFVILSDGSENHFFKGPIITKYKDDAYDVYEYKLGLK